MTVLFLLLYMLALVCFLFAAFGGAIRRVNLVALGLAFAVAVLVIQVGSKL